MYPRSNDPDNLSKTISSNSTSCVTTSTNSTRNGRFSRRYGMRRGAVHCGQIARRAHRPRRERIVSPAERTYRRACIVFGDSVPQWTQWHLPTGRKRGFTWTPDIKCTTRTRERCLQTDTYGLRVLTILTLSKHDLQEPLLVE